MTTDHVPLVAAEPSRLFVCPELADFIGSIPVDADFDEADFLERLACQRFTFLPVD